MSERTWSNLIALAVAIIVATALWIPVMHAIEEGQRLIAAGTLSPLERLHPEAVGPLSGMMVFVLAVPILITIAPTLIRKVTAVGLAAGGALVLSGIASAFQSGDTLRGWMMLAGATVGIVVFSRLERHGHRRRCEEVEVMARRLASMIDEAATSLHGWPTRQGRPGESAPSPEHAEEPRMVRSLALGVVWQARVSDRPEAFEGAVRRGLARVRRDLEHSPMLDPSGNGRRLMNRIESRLGSVFGRSVPSPRWAMRPSGVQAGPTQQRRSMTRAGGTGRATMSGTSTGPAVVSATGYTAAGHGTAGHGTASGSTAGDRTVSSTRVLV